ncbi:hypothetical protein L1887_08887 [Cichorium endivia]|nr:hypothetical protein L1887_08887 [Cichorium endivia]
MCMEGACSVLEEYSSFSVKEVGRSVSTAVSVENGGSVEAKAAAYWMTLTPNVEDYGGPPPMGMYSPTNSTGGSSNGKPPRTEEDDLKDLEALLNKKSFKELQKSKTGEELLDLIYRPTVQL